MVETRLYKTLSSIWLRPERALLDSQLYEVAEPVLRRYHQSPALDLAAGEGTPTLLMQGGRLHFLADEHVQHVQNKAIWFPPFSNSAARRVCELPAKPLFFDVGTCWTSRQAAMARQLEVHNTLLLSSINDFPNKVSRKNWKFILSHNAFWTNPTRFLHHVALQRSLLAEEGTILLLIPNKGAWLNAYKLLVERKVFDGLQYGKLFSNKPFLNALKNAMNASELEILWANSDFECVHQASAGSLEALLFYGTGLRGVFPALSHLVLERKSWRSDAFELLKKSWITDAYEILHGFFDEGVGENSVLAWHLVVLGRR